MGLGSLWGRLFTFTYDPQEHQETSILSGLPKVYLDVGMLLEKHRPDLLNDYRMCANLPPRDFGKFLDRSFPMYGQGYWGTCVSVSEVVPKLRSILGDE